jgi:hypothetical protein
MRNFHCFRAEILKEISRNQDFGSFSEKCGQGLLLLQILWQVSVQCNAIPDETFAPSFVTEQQHGENEVRGQNDIPDKGTKHKTTAARKKTVIRVQRCNLEHLSHSGKVFFDR